MNVSLRPVATEDITVFFDQQNDPAARHMAAFGSKDPNDFEAFKQHWLSLMSSNSRSMRTILADEEIAGNIVSFMYRDLRHVGYWLGRDYWGKGIATQALQQFLDEISERPLYARVAQDNIGSRRVLEKCGFAIIDEDHSGYAEARGRTTPEFILRLDA